MTDDEALLCVMCGFCRSVCPVFAVSRAESDNARGLIQAANALQLGTCSPSAEIARQFYHCTECHACERICPCGIKVSTVVEGARRTCAQLGFEPAPLAEIADNLERAGNIFGPAANLSMKPAPLHRSESKNHRLLAFLGCRAACDDPKLATALLDILDGADIDYGIFGQDANSNQAAVCCGHPLTFCGNEKRLQRFVQRSAERIHTYSPDLIVTSCSVCHMMLNDIYPKLLDDWNLTVLTAVQYIEKMRLSSAIAIDKPLSLKVIYHDPCKLGKHDLRFDAPRQALMSVPGLSLLEFQANRENTLCCGGGCGMPAITHQLAHKMAWRRVNQALDAGADVLATTCPACKKQFNAALANAASPKSQLKIMDVIELLALARA